MLTTNQIKRLNMLASRFRANRASPAEIAEMDALEALEAVIPAPTKIITIYDLPVAKALYNADMRDCR